MDAPPDEATLAPLAQRARQLLAHAWMIRTFIKHAPETADFPELMAVARVIFDVARAVASRADPVGTLQLLKKKLGKLRQAADQFREQGPLASDHENFRQAVCSLDLTVADLEALVAALPRGALHPAQDRELPNGDGGGNSAPLEPGP